MDKQEPFDLQESRGNPGPLVLDSPHSGRLLGSDLSWSGDIEALLACEDCAVDQLVEGAPGLGAALLRARFSRHHIDLNRCPDDIDPAVVSGNFPGSRQAHPAGGVVRALPGQSRKLSRAELDQRLRQAWWPYHVQLAELLARRRRCFPVVWHWNIHSMPSLVRTASGQEVDIVLGDRRGTTAHYEVTRQVAAMFMAEGLRVAINNPYEGAEIVRRHGNPAGGIHSVQIEFNRALFLDEKRMVPSADFDATRQMTERVIACAMRGLLESAGRPLAAE